VASVLKRVRPDVTLVLGGPEVSHETDRQPVCALADHVVRGEADLAFASLCRDLLAGARPPRVVDAAPPDLALLAWPYGEYTDADLAHRVVYVEASRGCPFTCEFCLSSLDDGVRQAPLDGFLQQMQRLLDRGLRHFKFVDRTFNLKIDSARAILAFFRARFCDGLFLHFELIPDRLPPALRDEIAAFPPGALQFEVGVQTLDPEVSARIARRQDERKLAENLRWLRDHTGVHVHADLIAGLPGEDLASFGRGFDRLLALGPQEIQVGILKRLRGTPIVRHDAEWGVVWSEAPPYEVLQTNALPFGELQRLQRFARYWDLVANSGNWPATVRLLLGGASAFGSFLAFSDWLFATAQATHGIAKHRLAALLSDWLVEHRGAGRDLAGATLAADYTRTARGDWPEFLRPWMRTERACPGPAGNPAAARQARHLAGGQA
jgi:hypothetical protein